MEAEVANRIVRFPEGDWFLAAPDGSKVKRLIGEIARKHKEWVTELQVWAWIDSLNLEGVYVSSVYAYSDSITLYCYATSESKTSTELPRIVKGVFGVPYFERFFDKYSGSFYWTGKSNKIINELPVEIRLQGHTPTNCRIEAHTELVPATTKTIYRSICTEGNGDQE